MEIHKTKFLTVSEEGLCAEFETEQKAIKFYWHSQEKGVKAKREGKKVFFWGKNADW